ncbi:shugoshin-1-like isoform X2 [Rutidosis leptorrhynchoides]|uniref:shugoshin-1-like isoform X2 n=1 Tax=Rutidosis leptorrhynchoides TaxID=125765 RepID=UPI003A991468
MESVFGPNSKNDVVIEDKPKVEKMTKDSIGNSGRKILGDISNVSRKPSILNQDNKARASSATVREYIEQIQKENAALVKLVADKKVIELSGAEVNKLRITIQKMQQQNIQLAQSNSQMLAELNSRKDRLKDLQHQLGCKNALLIAKQKEMEGKRKVNTCETKEIKKLKVSEDKGMGVCVVAESENDQRTNGRQKSKSLVPSTRKVMEQSVGDNGRLQTRRQSARFKHEEPKAKEEVIHTENVDLAPCSSSNDRMQGDDLNSSNFSVKKEDVDNDSRPSISNNITQGSKRSSISRPSREAAKKVQTYKEISLHVKLRRPE